MSRIDLSFNYIELVPYLPILLTIVFFSIYWFVSKSEKIKAHYYNKYDHDEASFKHLFFAKTFGGFILGLVPLILSLFLLVDYSISDYGLTYIPETTLFSLVWIAGLCAVLIPLGYFSSQKPSNLIQYPQVRSKVWTRKMLRGTALGWFIYLLGYETMFRGLLLFPLVDELGVWPAVLINVCLYSAVHIPKGLKETVGSIPLGAVLCVLTIYSGTIWIAFLVHVCLAWTNLFTSLKFHPEMNYVGKSKNLPEK